MKYRLDSLRNVRKFYQKIINDYYNNFDESLTDTKFKNLSSSLNGISKVIEQSDLELRVETLEAQLNDKK